MGKKPDELQREIAEHRDQISRKFDDLDGRVRSGVRRTGDEISMQFYERTRIRDYAEKRPLTSLAGAFGAGIMLGLVTDGGRSRPQSKAQPYSNYSPNGNSSASSGGGMLNSLLGSASGLVGGSFQDELHEFFRQLLGTAQPSGTSREYERAVSEHPNIRP